MEKSLRLGGGVIHHGSFAKAIIDSNTDPSKLFYALPFYSQQLMRLIGGEWTHSKKKAWGRINRSECLARYAAATLCTVCGLRINFRAGIVLTF